LIAWKRPIGCPNWTRTRACSAAMSRQAWAAPRLSAAVRIQRFDARELDVLAPHRAPVVAGAHDQRFQVGAVQHIGHGARQPPLGVGLEGIAEPLARGDADSDAAATRQGVRQFARRRATDRRQQAHGEIGRQQRRRRGVIGEALDHRGLLRQPEAAAAQVLRKRQADEPLLGQEGVELGPRPRGAVQRRPRGAAVGQPAAQPCRDLVGVVGHGLPPVLERA
jgi:hypothetical protein